MAFRPSDWTPGREAIGESVKDRPTFGEILEGGRDEYGRRKSSEHSTGKEEKEVLDKADAERIIVTLFTDTKTGKQCVGVNAYDTEREAFAVFAEAIEAIGKNFADVLALDFPLI